MPIYKQTTELTKCADWLTAAGHDIQYVYFGDQQVFTVWDTYDGTLPATYTANGSMLADYRVYGSAGGVGDRTVNIYDWTDTGYGLEYGRTLSIDGSSTANGNWCISSYIEVEPLTAYTINWYVETPYLNTYLCEYDESYNFIGSVAEELNKTFTTSQQTKYLRLSNVYRNATRNRREDCVLVEGSTAPAEYVPYGYEVDISVQSENLFNPSDTTLNYRYDDNGNWVQDSYALSSGFMEIAAGDKYEYSFVTVLYENAGGCRINFLNANRQWLSVNRVMFDVNVGDTVTITGTAPAGTAFVRTSQLKDEKNISMIKQTTTPIYIGSDPLNANGSYADYVDYQSQKIKRRIKTRILDGSETFTPISQYPGVYTLPISGQLNTDTSIAYSSNYYTWWQWIINGAQYGLAPDKSLFGFKNFSLYVKDTDYASAADFKNHVKELYDAGTPLTVTYVTREYYDTDPPVPLPILPTVDGTTITNYAGQSAVPSEFYAKYRKQNF